MCEPEFVGRDAWRDLAAAAAITQPAGQVNLG